MEQLSGRHVAILSTDGFEESELIEPKKALEKAGAKVDVISPKGGKIKGWKHTDWGKEVAVDVELADADSTHYDAVMLPGGVMNPDKLRLDEKAVEFLNEFIEAGKPIAAISHGPQILIETGFLDGRTMTSWPSLKTDLENAGATWIDEEVVVDGNLVTSRKPQDLPAFNKKMIETFEQGPHFHSITDEESKAPSYLQ